uniref:Tetraacyldisaccharide 4'-kinase n=1 Tax=Anthurium amnicola TaxID=1678845 RepID=A0A1D1ZLQ4_9ARAE
MTQIMASIPRSTLPLLLGLFLTSSLATPAEAGDAPAAAGDAPPTAYEMLERHGFPRGILPEGVESYVLREDGSFEVYLGGRRDCDFAVEGGYLLNYKRRITGRLDEASGALRQLKGVSVKVLFVWFGISEVVHGGDVLSFHLGPLSASFPLSNFEECPRCRCGFDCAAMVSDS